MNETKRKYGPICKPPKESLIDEGSIVLKIIGQCALTAVDLCVPVSYIPSTNLAGLREVKIVLLQCTLEGHASQRHVQSNRMACLERFLKSSISQR